VKSVVPEGDPLADIKDIKGPVALEGVILSLPFLLGILFLIALIAYFVLRRRHIPQESPTVPPSPPHVIALEALDRLDAMGLSERDVKEYHFLVSGVLRRYLEDRFGFKAPEQTTDEFLEAVLQDHILDKAQKGLLKAFLEQCDLVKFARWIPTNQQTKSVSKTVRDFVHETKLILQAE